MSSAVKHIISGKKHWPKELLKQLKANDAISVIGEENKSKDKHRLTPRQNEVLKLICDRGLSNKQIAKQLSISESTVKIHVSVIMKEYCVRNRTQLALAERNSLKA
jgi:DNA-binding NarL/FixJ family response regulator